ncbi:MAG: alpha/beta hydrolase [Chloroflexi bacterium]|nr:alpha/beta hydrolase [Chloroflexota bacterium]
MKENKLGIGKKMDNHTQNSPVKRLRWLVVAVFVVIIGGSLWGIRWATFTRQPLPEAVRALESDEWVEITNEPWLIFSPAQVTPNTGFIFYPGGRIDPRGYAPVLKAIASKGYLVVAPEMPINMAPFRPNIADEIIANYPDIGRWVIGGHSVGGTMAVQYTNTHREIIDGLVIWASYPANNADLADFDLPVTLIYGSRDPRVNDSSVAKCQHLLPQDTVYIRIDGGDHHQFGSYEIDSENHHATIGRDLQHEQIVQSTLDLIKVISDTE